MAPAANESANGSIISTETTSSAPMTPATGSTMPDACPSRKLRFLEYPSLLRGMETAAPSGKFCNPIPTAIVTAPIKVSTVYGTFPNAPKATPTANPSGILWIVIERTSMRIRFNRSFAFPCVLSARLLANVTIWSDAHIKHAPERNPIVTTT